MKKFKLVEARLDDEWDKFIDSSKNGTIFSNSFFLKHTNYKIFYCYQNSEIKAAIALTQKDGKIILDDLVIYNGIIYANPQKNQNHSQTLSEQFQIQEFIANELTNLFNHIEMRLHPSIVDIRAFLWVNYGTNLPKYQHNIRYTSYIDISDFRKVEKLEDISIYNKASTSRRQQIRYALKKGYETKAEEISKLDKFIELYIMTMKRQNLEIDSYWLNKMKKLSYDLISKNKAKLYGSYDENGELGSMAIFAWDNKRAYYLYGANHPDKRKGHTGTDILWKAFYDLSSMGIDEVDLEGVNSPYRGWFKLSFGGDIIPYYYLKYEGD